jgi:ATP-binding cassette subfamily F protein uup
MLLTLRDVGFDLAGRALLAGADLAIDAGERVCLVGRNGAGKSTLLRLVTGRHAPDRGEIVRRPGLRVGYLEQEGAGLAADGTTFDVVAAGLGDVGALLAEFHRLSHAIVGHDDADGVARLADVQHRLEAAGGWALRQRVETTVSRLGLPADVPFATLSGGARRRALLARALVIEPDLLLLDEPTNHLDLPSIDWLEGFLAGFGGALLFVTHDRAFLQRLATRIVELDRGVLASYPGDYATYRRRRAEEQAAAERAEAEFDKKLAREEAWIRQGIKARRTRNEGRVRALQALREQRRRRRERVGTVRLAADRAAPSGRRVIEVTGLRYGYEGTPVVDGLDTTVLKGDRVGIVGPNGIGKSTLLKLLLGELEPQQGRVRHGSGLEIAYFDQHRAPLDEESTLIDLVGQGRDSVRVNGRERHVISYLQDFLFTPAQTRAPLRTLSGGERSRGLLARLFCRPSNLLVMDEPTNDLDIETLELLEELLLDYDGTLLLVSHDRAFIDNVVTSTLVFEGAGRVAEYVGGYDDWLRQRPAPPAAEANARPARAARPRPKPAARKKLGYREQRELDGLPQQIEALEGEQAELHAALADPGRYRDGGDNARDLAARLREVETGLTAAYARWEALEAGDG